MSEIKVLHIIGNLEAGGAEKLLVETLPLLNAKKGITASLLLFDGKQTPFKKMLLQSGVTVDSLGRNVFSPKYVFKLIPYLKLYDIVHVHLFPALYLVVLAKIVSFAKVKLVFTEHNTENKRMNNPKLRFLERFFYSFYTRIICISDAVHYALVSKLNVPNQKLVTIQNGVNLNEINKAIPYLRNNFGFLSSDKLMIMTASFRIQKDQHTLIRSLLKLPANYKLLLIGEGENLEECKQLVFSLSLEKRIFFLGLRTDVYSVIKMCDVAVLSSHWEGFGLVAIESMACGIPTIVSDVPGLAQVVGDGGMLFEKGNDTDLADKILKITSNSEDYLYYVSKGRHKASKYDINLVVENQISLYYKIKIGHEN